MNTLIFTDGSSRGNPGPGGWACVIISDPRSEKAGKGNDMEVTELGGGEKHTTNNRMELMAVIQGLGYVKEKIVEDQFGEVGNASLVRSGLKVIVYTDSSYIIKGISTWVHIWKRNGWKTKAKEGVLNKDLWMMLSDVSESLTDSAEVKWEIIPGHSGIAGNERCDAIATSFADGSKVSLYKGTLSGYNIKDILSVEKAKNENDGARSQVKRSHSRAKAYSYVSSIGGMVKVHDTWPECEKRVKGVRGARYKKAINKEDESGIIKEFRQNR